MDVWTIVLLIFGVAELWTFFIEPSIKAREDAAYERLKHRIELEKLASGEATEEDED